MKKTGPEVEFSKGKWGCVMWVLSAASKGRVAIASEETFGCWGGGWIRIWKPVFQLPRGLECFYRFLSPGNEVWDKGMELALKTS